VSIIDGSDIEASEIAALRRQLEELRERESHLRMAMEASRVVAYRWDIADDRVTRLRSARDPSDGFEYPGGFEAIVAKVVPEDRARFRADIAAALESKVGLYRTEVRYVDGAGVIRWVSESGRVQRDAAGRPVRIVGVTFDITERKQAEESLQRALATLSHELRNPLAPIRNAFEILRRPGAAPETVAKMHAIVDRQMSHLVRLVDDLLDVSRIGRGRLELRREWVSLQSVVNQAIEAARPGIDALEHELDVSFPPVDLKVDGDRVRLVQAVLNLLTNAAKYTPRAGAIRLEVKEEAGWAAIRVADNGIGMSPEELAQAFDMFWQASGVLDSRGGLGIGLSLARTIVALHGGELAARSDGHGRGSEFILRLPLVR
jgi:signal transduction histidine kinase